MRNGEFKPDKSDAALLVPGDIVRVDMGDKIPADILCLTPTDFKVAPCPNFKPLTLACAGEQFCSDRRARATGTYVILHRRGCHGNQKYCLLWNIL